MNNGWKLKRLRAMSLGEVIYRVRGALHGAIERRGFRRASAPAANGVCGRQWADALCDTFDQGVYRAAADRVLAGRFDVFAMVGVELGFPPTWNKDPKTQRTAPLLYGKTLEYRDERVVGDIKYLWEPNRHAELVSLAQAWHLTRDESYAEGCRTLLESWFEQCPYPLGPNWTSSLEHAIRLVNWAVTWFLLGDGSVRDTDVEFRRRWLDSIYKHCCFIHSHFSRYSSANNHLLGELMGLFVASTVWPMWPESTSWRASAAAEFEAEALKQNGEDGVNLEQAIWYQHEVADMMLLVGLFGRANGIEFSPPYWERLERMLEFLSALMDVGGNVPMIGDADDARLVRFAPVDVYRSLLATGAVVFQRGDFKAKAGSLDDKTRWLLGAGAQRAFETLPEGTDAELRRNFPCGGYAVLGTNFGSRDEIKVVVDDGPLGYLSIAAHGHADALALTLSVGGREVLIDCGTFSYHTQRIWRDYFKGTAAHNTVRVDGADQSVSGGNFLWTQHASSRRDRFDVLAESEVWQGSHTGYLRLRDPVLHRRTAKLDKVARTLLVTDRLECGGTHSVDVFWHVHENCSVSVSNDSVLLHGQGALVEMKVTGWDASPLVARGQDDPPRGWVSRAFDRKIPCNTVSWSGMIQGTTEIATLFKIH